MPVTVLYFYISTWFQFNCVFWEVSSLMCSRTVHHVSISQPWCRSVSQAKLRFYNWSHFFSLLLPLMELCCPGMEFCICDFNHGGVGTPLLFPLFSLDTRWFEMEGQASQDRIPSASRSAPWKRQCFWLMICVDFLLAFLQRSLDTLVLCWYADPPVPHLLWICRLLSVNPDLLSTSYITVDQVARKTQRAGKTRPFWKL